MLHFYILAIVQIITESMPISSSGHQILVSCCMKYLCPNLVISPLVFSDTISYFLNMPTIIIVPVFFFHNWWPILKGWRRTWHLILRLILYTWAAATITAIIFLLVRSYHFRLPLWMGFGLTFIGLLSLLFCPQPGNKKFSLWYAVILGLLQGCAVIPGLSRFGLVYVSVRWLGFNARKSFEITWMIQWPLLLGASGVSIMMLYARPDLASLISIQLLIIMAVACMVSYYCLGVVYRLALAHHFWWISFYMLLPLFFSYYCFI